MIVLNLFDVSLTSVFRVLGLGSLPSFRREKRKAKLEEHLEEEIVEQNIERQYSESGDEENKHVAGHRLEDEREESLEEETISPASSNEWDEDEESESEEFLIKRGRKRKMTKDFKEMEESEGEMRWNRRNKRWINDESEENESEESIFKMEEEEEEITHYKEKKQEKERRRKSRAKMLEDELLNDEDLLLEEQVAEKIEEQTLKKRIVKDEYIANRGKPRKIYEDEERESSEQSYGDEEDVGFIGVEQLRKIEGAEVVQQHQGKERYGVLTKLIIEYTFSQFCFLYCYTAIHSTRREVMVPGRMKTTLKMVTR